MKILIVGDFKHEMYSKALFNAFKRIENDVHPFMVDEFNYKGNNNIFYFLERFQNRFLIGPKICQINSALLEMVKEQKPDLVFLYRTVEVNAKLISKIKSLGCIIFSYNNDDPFSGIPSKAYWRNYLKTAAICDHNFVYRQKNRIDFEKIGIENVSILKPYYIKENNFPIVGDKLMDVVFIGHFENDGRDKYIKALIDAGVNITVFGDEMWKQAPLYEEIKFVLKESKRGAEYNISLNEAKIALVFLSKINSDTYTRRCFEIPATKTLMLSEYTSDLNSMFEADKEAVYFTSSEDLVQKCKNLLNNPSIISEIGDAGYNKLLKDGHSIESRAKEILTRYSQVKK
ncbi:glycosyltransferase [Flavobacterium sandaracinum]|uniref:Glycosyltransferase family 1 protein n=1 Tax=Flavobacterium sandaracinum TaxID=2541733 RepID=A0A4R5D3L0_9FLAO|nr:glycosyltransferase [Flavobacterium sandaracinum]TDE04763.1 glycosyltransferase family 1 protein [Flavobacterium sandaracinum]